MSKAKDSPGSDQPNASTIAAGTETPETAAAPPAKPAPKAKPAAAPATKPAEETKPAPEKSSFDSFTDEMKKTLSYRG